MVRTPSPLTRGDWLISASIFAGTLLALLATMDMGLTRDESFYFHAAYDYIRWFEGLWVNLKAGDPGLSFTRQEVDRHWSYNPEHPVLMKTLFALSYKLMHQELGWLSLSESMRLPTALMSSWLVAMVYAFGRQLFGRAAGVAAAGALLLQPRFFFHAHLTCFDAPISAMWFAVVYAYWRAWGSRGWAWAAGVLWGLALATKLNAFFLPPLLVAHWLLVRWREASLRPDEQGRWTLRLPTMPLALVAMAALGPLIFYMHWPRIWFDTVKRVWWYMQFHLKHEHYLVEYFGQWHQHPPFPRSFPWVMTLVTVPTTILAAAALGVMIWIVERQSLARLGQWARALRARRLPEAASDERGTGLLLLINGLFPLVLIGQPHTPIFGGTKHWMPAMPYLAMMAGLGAVGAARWAAPTLASWLARASQEPQAGQAPADSPDDATLAQGQATAASQASAPGRSPDRAPEPSRALRAGLVVVALGALLGPAALELRANHPFGTSYYNELIGSYRGAADRRMMRQFWGYSSRQGLDWLNAHARPGARVYPHETTSWAFADMQREGLARPDLRLSGIAGSDFALYEPQRAFGFQLVQIWAEYGTRAPAHVITVDGVPVLSIYARPGAIKPPPRVAPAPR